MTLYTAGARPRSQPELGRDGTPWWATPYGQWRFSVEVEAMRRRFPGFRCRLRDGRMGWVGRLPGAVDPTTRYLVKVVYLSTFPDEPPVVTIEDPEIPSDTPHMTMGNRPCLFRLSAGPRSGYDAARTTAATLVAWTSLWIAAYEAWRRTHVWPGRAE